MPLKIVQSLDPVCYIHLNLKDIHFATSGKGSKMDV